MHKHIPFGLACLLAAACGGSSARQQIQASPDASTPASADAGSIDAGSADAGAEPPPSDAGVPPPSDAGAPPPPPIDAGSPPPPGDAGSPPPPPPPVDAGPPPDCDPDAGFDARCLDAGAASLIITPSSAPQCAGLLPIDVPAPLLYARSIGRPFGPYPYCGAIADGDGNLAVCSDTGSGMPADTRFTQILATDDGRTLAGLRGGVLISEPHGFIVHVATVDYGQASTITGWGGGDGGTILLDRGIPNPQFNGETCTAAEGPDWTVTVGCGAPDAGPTLQQFDYGLRPLGPRQPSEPTSPLAIDEQDALLSGSPYGPLQWHSRDGAALSPSFSGNVFDRRPLVGGGFDTNSGVLASRATTFEPRPAWLSDRPGALTLVRARKAYGYVTAGAGCTRRLELLAADGTLCATADFTELGCSQPPDFSLGAEGTLTAEAASYCRDGQCAFAWRVWPHLLK